MLSKWPIRNKLLIGLGLLLVIVATLAYSGFHGVYAYRSLVKSLSRRTGVLPLATVFSQRVSNLRVALSELRAVEPMGSAVEARFSREEFTLAAGEVRTALDDYRRQLTMNKESEAVIGDSRGEWETLHKIENSLAEIDRISGDKDWVLQPAEFAPLRSELDALQQLASDLPSHLHQSLRTLADEIRGQYRTLIVLVWLTTVAAGLMFILFVRLFYQWVFRPLRILIKGSRRVAAGDFEHHIRLASKDEMAELAEALNRMTERFRETRDDLDRQVQERTKQVIRSERLAGVGFLAAGVAHEINNPLASIAMCAESLEGRLEGRSLGDESENRVVQQYLRMIQNEAFRCKEITEKLLDFSRMGDLRKHPTDLRQIAQGVVEMIAHLGKYQGKHVELVPGEPLVAPVNPQELKQVVLNLLTNALDSLDPGGTVWVDLNREGQQAVLTFTDNGCGMSGEVLEHLFEPFFTRRRGGQGTGLGLSITYRIVADHNGQIDAASDGVGQGSQFRVTLPLSEGNQEEHHHRYQAA